MSFKTWWKDYCRNHDSAPSFGTVFEAGCATSEAQIATLQSERDALRKLVSTGEGLYKALMAICEFHGHCWCGECHSNLAGPGEPEGYTTFICRDTKEAIDKYRDVSLTTTLSTPASGEPARKP